MKFESIFGLFLLQYYILDVRSPNSMIMTSNFLTIYIFKCVEQLTLNRDKTIS